MIKKLASYIKEYKKDAILTPIFVIFEVVMEIVIPYLMARIIDVGIQNSDVKYILEIGVFLIVSAILSLIFGMLSGKYAAKASSGYAKNLRKAMFDKIQTYAFENIDKFSTSSLITRLTTDVTNVQNAFQMIIRTLVRGPIMMIFAVFMCFTISPKLACIFFVAIPVLGFLLIFIAKKAHPNFETVFKKYDTLNRVVQEDLNGIRVVKAYAKEDFEKQKFKNINDEVYYFFKKAEKIVAFNSPVMQLTIYTCILLISWFGSQLIVGGAMQTGQLSSIITYAWQILMSLMMLSMVFVMIIISQSSAERIIGVLDEEPAIKNKEKNIKTVEDGSIVFDNVSFCYSDEKDKNKFALRNINLEIKAGETTKLTIPAKLKNTNKSKVLNSVIVKEPEKEDKEDEVEVNIGKPTLNIYKEANVEEAMKGDEFLYYITIENNSNFNATNLTLTDLIDERLTILESDGGLISDNNITWTFNLSSNSQITFTIKVRVLENAQEGEISNIAILHQEEDISSNEVIVKIVDIINPQTGSILKYSFLVICIALTIIMIIYTKRKRKIFKI